MVGEVCELWSDMKAGHVALGWQILGIGGILDEVVGSLALEKLEEWNGGVKE